MAVIATFKYEVKPGRLNDFLVKLGEAADPRFKSDAMPKSVRVFRSAVPGPDTGVIVMVEHVDMAAYGARTAFEIANPEWQRLFEPGRDAPHALLSVELLTELPADRPSEAVEHVPFGFR